MLMGCDFLVCGWEAELWFGSALSPVPGATVLPVLSWGSAAMLPCCLGAFLSPVSEILEYRNCCSFRGPFFSSKVARGFALSFLQSFILIGLSSSASPEGMSECYLLPGPFYGFQELVVDVPTLFLLLDADIVSLFFSL